MPSTSRRRSRRRSSRYYPDPRAEKLKRWGMGALIVLIAIVAAGLAWAAMFADRTFA
ncbi:hypothetical protein [Herbiconiux sp.]|uniref:hypothetical protein n=1 Tax=Herbiconiux sp. TaxID=1871186 RepID=UPI0025C1CF0A|nr:hypothetical protein [Herbiconiux sp.]